MVKEIFVTNGQISSYELTEDTKTLIEEGSVRVSPKGLENRNSNITTYLTSITNAFSDFRLVAQIREEIEKVKQIEILAKVPAI